MRPRQWTKNLLVFASALFGVALDGSIWINSIIAFISFCVISSAVYIFNDIRDKDSDCLHITKCKRPIASGKLKVTDAYFYCLLMAFISIVLALAVSNSLALLIILYALIQISYCLGLKRQPLLDLFCIAAGFLLRAVAGLISTNLGASPWFILTIGLLAMFLAIEKRKAELRVSISSGVVTRKVLLRYSLPLLQRLESLVASSSFMAYALWSAGPSLNGASTGWMLLSVPFVLVGIFRYQLLSDPQEVNRRILYDKNKTTEKPEEILLSDKGIQYTMIAWLVTITTVNLLYKFGMLP